MRVATAVAAALSFASLQPAIGAAMGHVTPPAACTAILDGFCGNASRWSLGEECYASIRKAHGALPLVAALSSAATGGVAWRCYSPSALTSDPSTTPLLDRKYNTKLMSKEYCSIPNNALGELYGREPCSKGDTNPVVFASGHIPSLAYVPPGAPGAHPTNGTLVAFMQPLAAAVSTDHGATWARSAPPVAGTPGPASEWCCPQSLHDPATKSLVLQFGNATREAGGCDIGVEQLGGVLQVRSHDAGATWTEFTNVQSQLRGVPTPCMSPTSGAGVVMRPVNGRYGGRLVFCAVRNAYEGDIPVFSDDGGKSYNFSTGVYKPGLDECNIAQATNGSLLLIARNCEEGNLRHCQMLRDGGDHGGGVGAGGGAGGVGNHRFAVSVSDDGGETWGPISYQPQLVTPVCQGSIISYQGPADAAPALYFAGPGSDTARVNGTIRASDDSGVTFGRTLNLGIPTTFGYTGLTCGIVGAPGGADCGVLYDAGGALRYASFRSADVK